MPLNIGKIYAKLTGSFNSKIDDAPFLSVVLFVGTWLCLGNFWSLLCTYWHVEISLCLTILSAVIYLFVAIPVVFYSFRELVCLKCQWKWIVIAELIVFFTFVIAPPRNADAMRVWLAKVFDVWMHGEKILRPYFHYNTPDAFTLFHLPLINLWDGQIFQLSIWVALCAVLIVLIKIARVYLSERAIVVGICLFIFNPVIILASTAIITDIPMILAVAGLIYSMILYDQERFNRSLILVALFTAFGMNIKYNMLMFLPALFCWLIATTWKKGMHCKSSLLIFVFIGLAILPYYMNYINIGNPVWPGLSKLFPSNNPSWDEMAFASSLKHLEGSRTLWSFVQSFSRLFIMPYHINPLAMATVFFVFVKFRYLGYVPAVFVTTYFFILWLMMPDFATSMRERYVLYLFPIIIPLGLSRIYEMASSFKNAKKLKQLLETSVVITIVIYSTFTIAYSYDSFQYLVTHDKSKWHRATWYYKDYDWINKNISLDNGDKILVLSIAQQTYYLKKSYISADGMSAAVNWSDLSNIEEIVKMLSINSIKYIFVDATYLKGDGDAKKAISIAEKEKVIKKVRESRTKLYTSRVRDIYRETRTVLYKVILNDHI